MDRIRSEEHTSELQSQSNLVCRLLLEKKKNSFSSRRGGQAWPSTRWSAPAWSSPAAQSAGRSSRRACTCTRTPRWSFFFNDTATTEIYTLSLHDALPI